MTVPPEKKRLSARTTLPEPGDLIGVPEGLRKSAPEWALRGCPLKMLRVPNTEFARCGTGRLKKSRAGFGPAVAANAAATAAVSLAIRDARLEGGLTKSGSTSSVRVA